MNNQNLSNLDNAQLTYGDNLNQIQMVTNMNTGFRGPRGLNRTEGVNVSKLDNWIKCLSDRGGVLAERPLATYTLPGSHDALTYRFTGGVIRRLARGGTVTQELNLTSQFNAGIRYFDIRVGVKGGKLIGVHGPINLLGGDIESDITNLLILAVQNKEPIVIKFDYKGKAYSIVKKIVTMFSKSIMPTSEYWKVGVGDCIRQGKVLCLFHKIKSKQKETFKDASEMFGDYSKHKAGGFSNKHFMKGHRKYLEDLVDEAYTLDEERLKVMSFNIPCTPTGGYTALGVANFFLGSIPSKLCLAAQVAVRVKRENRWLGCYESVSNIEQREVVKDINLGVVQKLTDAVDSWYFMEEKESNPIESALHGEKVSQHIAGAVGMDFVGRKRQLILELIELNNRDY
ncbi:hypothetical protein [Moritella sp. 28]|uniref:hypothetical protein n=1 Tax=Moritella sp. 28 TaxID=2746232 RepID=UPI001BA8267D|nr:hypothetical protein [Moritella sp. 28]QUM85083.1 hypothetical protein HWV02_11525 [Moritella sp. 28]